ncbi:MAG: PqqD family protein [Clostridia bacterium]|nr:PqqD family protein [Clostridia bacterium]
MALQKVCGTASFSEDNILMPVSAQNAGNEDEIVEKILEEYDVSREQAAEDVLSYLAELREKGIL